MRQQPRTRMLRLRSCPRCGGDLMLDMDDEDHKEGEPDEYACLQCGRRAKFPPTTRPEEEREPALSAH